MYKEFGQNYLGGGTQREGDIAKSLPTPFSRDNAVFVESGLRYLRFTEGNVSV